MKRTKPRSELAVTVVAGTAALALTLLWLARPSPGPKGQAANEATTTTTMTTAPPARARGSLGSRPSPPVFAVAPAPVDGGPSPPGGMSEGLAADLKMFDRTQLRAELESIATSYPGVVLGAVVCAALPCLAEASSLDAEQMNGFVQMVSARFQGHLRTRLVPRLRAGRTWIEGSFQIGTAERHMPARYPR